MTTIKLKNGSGAPTAGDLVTAEPALDLTNKRLYTEDSGGTVIEVGTNPGTDVTFADNRKAIFGTGSDLQIYHSGSASFISDQGTGNLKVLAQDFAVNNPADSANMITAAVGGAVTAFHNGAVKLATTSTGIDVTGTVTADGANVGSPVASFGVLRVGHTGDNTQAVVIGDGATSANDTGIYLRSDTLGVISVGASASMAFKTGGGSGTQRLNIGSGGDISFYEDTGTTAKLLWSAADERLGIGDTSPDGILDVEGSITIAASQAGVIFNPTVTPANNNVGSVGLVSGTLNAPASANASSKISGLRVAPTTSGSFNGAGEIAGIKVETFNGQSASIATGLYVDAPTGGDVNYAAILNGGNVGIGTSSPLGILSVGDHTNTSGTTSDVYISGDQVNADDYYARLLFKNSNQSGGSTASIRGERLSNNNGTGLTFYTNGTGSAGDGTERMRIDSSGNLLVGKTSASVGTDGAQLLTGGYSGVSATSTTAFFANRNSTDGDVVEIGKNGVKVGSIGYGGGGILFNAASQYGLKFYDAGGSNIIHPATTAGGDKDASVDLGYADSRFKDLYLSGGVYWGSDQDASNNTTTNGTDIIQGNIRIASTSYCLDLNRANAVDGELARFRKQATQVGGISVTGSSTSYNTSSDYRLKENVVAISGATERLKQLRPSRFNFIADPDTTVDGFLAHEVQDIVPEAITGEKDAMRDEEYEVTPAVLDDDGNVVTEAVMGTRSVPDYQGIDQSKLVPLLVATIQELEARITALESH